MGLVTSSPLFHDDNANGNEDDLNNIPEPYSCYNLFEYPRLLFVPQQQSKVNNRTPVLTASSCEEEGYEEKLDSDQGSDNDPLSMGETSELDHSCHVSLLVQQHQQEQPPMDTLPPTYFNSERQRKRRTTSPRRNRVFDIYQTDSTLMVPMDDDDDDDINKDWFPSVTSTDASSPSCSFASSTSSRSTIPFRRCNIQDCPCGSTTTSPNSTGTFSAKETKSLASRSTSSTLRHHPPPCPLHQADMEDRTTHNNNLVGLAILPCHQERQSISSDFSEVSTNSSSSSNIARYATTGSKTSLHPPGVANAATNGTTTTTKPPRLPISPTSLPSLPKVGIPRSRSYHSETSTSLHKNDDGVYHNCRKESTRSSSRVSLDEDEHGRIPDESFATIMGKTMRSASATTLSSSTFRKKYQQERQLSMAPDWKTKVRARSEDVVDVPGHNRNNPGTCLQPKGSSSSSKTTINNNDSPDVVSVTTTTVHDSPTSVLHRQFPIVPSSPGDGPVTTPVVIQNTKTTTIQNDSCPPSSMSLCVSMAETFINQGRFQEARSEYRRLLSVWRQNLSPHGKADLYHRLGWTHFRESRYMAGLCVVKHAIDVLQLAYGCLTLDELIFALTNTPAKISNIIIGRNRGISVHNVSCQLADLILTQAKIYASLGDYVQSKRLAKMALTILAQKQNLVDGTSQIIFAKGLLVMGKLYATCVSSKDVSGERNEENEESNEQAMQHYHQALQIFSYYDQHSYVAETIQLIGEASPWVDLANQSYNQALMIQYHQHVEHCQPQDDIATSLGRLGWNSLVQGHLDSAMQFTQQALERTRTPRNIASTHYQLGMIYSRLGDSFEALRHLKRTLKIQRTVFAGVKTSHIDTGRTCEAIALEYQRISKFDRARDFLEAALNICNHYDDKNRLVSRLQNPRKSNKGT